MAGLNQTSALNKKQNKVSTDAKEEAMLTFARAFGRSNGQGECLANSYRELEKAVGKGKAASVCALCWFLGEA